MEPLSLETLLQPSPLPREVACEDTERFVLSTPHLTAVRGVVKKLEEQRTRNMRTVMEACEKLDR